MKIISGKSPHLITDHPHKIQNKYRYLHCCDVTDEVCHKLSDVTMQECSDANMCITSQKYA